MSDDSGDSIGDALHMLWNYNLFMCNGACEEATWLISTRKALLSSLKDCISLAPPLHASGFDVRHIYPSLVYVGRLCTKTTLDEKTEVWFVKIGDQKIEV